MSQERRKKQQLQTEAEQPSKIRISGKTIVLAIVVVAAGLAAAMTLYRQQHRYDAFARCLTDRHVLMYGAWWCPHCVEEKEKFGASFKYAPYIECGTPGNTRGEQQVCKDAGIKHFPTWQFPPVGERVEGTLPLQELSDRSGCPLP